MCGPTVPVAAFQGAELAQRFGQLLEELEGLVPVQSWSAHGQHRDGAALVLDELGDRQVGHGPEHRRTRVRKARRLRTCARSRACKRDANEPRVTTRDGVSSTGVRERVTAGQLDCVSRAGTPRDGLSRTHNPSDGGSTPPGPTARSDGCGAGPPGGRRASPRASRPVRHGGAPPACRHRGHHRPSTFPDIGGALSRV